MGKRIKPKGAYDFIVENSMTIGTGLYVKNSKAAVELYTRAFGLTLGYHVKNEDGSFFHSDLCKDGKPVFSVVEGKGSEDESIIQLGIEFENAAEVQKVYDIFVTDGAKIDMPIGKLPWSTCAASVVDRFGVWWYFCTGSHQPDDDFKPGK